MYGNRQLRLIFDMLKDCIQACHHAVVRGVAAPAAWSHIDLASLVKLASTAAEKYGHLLREPVGCNYLGQVYGPPGRQQYRHNPVEWRIPKGQWHSHQTVAFVWSRGGAETVTEQVCNNCVQRGVAPPITWLTDEREAMELTEQLRRAAHEAAESLSQETLSEFGFRFVCKHS